MYCPGCGNQNINNAKFCRACGRDLESVSLAVNNKFAAPSDWLELYSESKSNITTAAIMGGGALLIWAVPAFFVRDLIGWSVLWSVFFGWLAIWGIIKLATNAGDLVKAKTMLKAQPLYNPELPLSQQQYSLPEPPANSQIPNYRYDTDQLKSPTSVTEHTTKFLDRK